MLLGFCPHEVPVCNWNMAEMVRTAHSKRGPGIILWGGTSVIPGPPFGVSLAISTFSPSVHSPQMVWECVCVYVEWTWSTHYVGISTYQFVPYYASAMHKHTHPQTICGQWTNGAKSGYCHLFCGGYVKLWLIECVSPVWSVLQGYRQVWVGTG